MIKEINHDDNGKRIKQFGFLPPPYGGVSVYLLRLGNKLNRDGYRSSTFFLSSQQGVQSIALINEGHCALPSLKLGHMLRAMPVLLHEFYRNDIIHSHFGIECAMHLLITKALFKKLGIVVMVHDQMMCERFYNIPFIKRISFRLLLRMKRVVLVAVSLGVADELSHITPRGQRIEIVPAYIPVILTKDSFSVLPEEMKVFLQHHNKRIFIYGHSFREYNGSCVYGFEKAIEAFSYVVSSGVADCGLVICVDPSGDNGKLVELEKKIFLLGLSDRVFWQLQPINDMGALWNEIDVYLRPTYTDGDSVAVREAMSFGVTVIASDVVCRPDGVICYRYEQQDDLNKKLRAALESGRNRGYQELDYGSYNKMLDIYKSLGVDPTQEEG